MNMIAERTIGAVRLRLVEKLREHFPELLGNFYVVVDALKTSPGEASIVYLSVASRYAAELRFQLLYEKESARQMADMESMA